MITFKMFCDVCECHVEWIAALDGHLVQETDCLTPEDIKRITAVILCQPSCDHEQGEGAREFADENAQGLALDAMNERRLAEVVA